MLREKGKLHPYKCEIVLQLPCLSHTSPKQCNLLQTKVRTEQTYSIILFHCTIYCRLIHKNRIKLQCKVELFSKSQYGKFRSFDLVNNNKVRIQSTLFQALQHMVKTSICLFDADRVLHFFAKKETQLTKTVVKRRGRRRPIFKAIDCTMQASAHKIY